MPPSAPQNPVLLIPSIPKWTPSAPPVTAGKDIESYFGITCFCDQEPGCLILDLFGCTFDKAHKYVFCKQHAFYISSSELYYHLSLQHQHHLENLGPATGVVNKIQKHLYQLHGITADQRPPTSGMVLKWRIPGNRDIKFLNSRRCPQCKFIFVEPRQVKVHSQKVHKNDWRDVSWDELAVVEVAQKAFEGKQHIWCEVLPELKSIQEGVVAPSISDISLPPTTLGPLPPPQFCQDLGYISWIQSMGKDHVYNLLAIPGTHLTRGNAGKDGQLERLLLQVHTFLKDYLGSGEKWLYSHYREFQKVIRKGYGFTSSPQIIFQLNSSPLVPGTPLAKFYPPLGDTEHHCLW